MYKEALINSGSNDDIIYTPVIESKKFHKKKNNMV